MNIFNVLKYPISTYPTAEEFSNVPLHVYKRWRKKVRIGGNICYDQESQWYRFHVDNEVLFQDGGNIIPVCEVVKNDLALLRRMIGRMKT